MKEKFMTGEKLPVKQKELPKHEEMFLDQSLYDLHVDEIRHEGAKRERKGVMTAIKSFLNTPKGRSLGIAFAVTSGAMNVGVVAGHLVERRDQQDIYAIDNYEPSPDSFAGDRPLEEVRGELTAWLGEEAVRDLIPVSSSDRDRSSRERRREGMREAEIAEIEGFEEVGIPHELVEEYLEEGFPRFMTARGNVESIEFTTEHRPMREDYHLGHGAEAAGTCSIGEGEEASEIHLYGALLDSNGRLEVLPTFNTVLIHELAHAIDWENLDAVDPATRTRMLHQMVSRVRDDGHRLHFSYVERISSDDPSEQLRNRAVEYYAEFTAAVFRHAPDVIIDDPFWEQDLAGSLITDYRDPEVEGDSIENQELFQAVRDDIALVREVVAAYDPEFDWNEARVRRAAIVERMMRERTLGELRRATSTIASTQARELIEERLEAIAEPATRDAAYFIRHAGTRDPEAGFLYEGEEISREEYVTGRDLEREIVAAQTAAIRELEADIAPDDMPAYRALTSLLETLADFDPSHASTEEVDAIRDIVEEYAALSRRAGSRHYELAREHFEVIQGARHFPASLSARVDRYLDEIDFASRG